MMADLANSFGLPVYYFRKAASYCLEARVLLNLTKEPIPIRISRFAKRSSLNLPPQMRSTDEEPSKYQPTCRDSEHESSE